MRKVMESKNGFTLAELLVVVVIIGVLVGVSIPVFSTQLEKSREATDLANVRSAYAQVMEAAIVDDTTSPFFDELNNEYRAEVPLKQKEEGWTSEENLCVGGVSITDRSHWKNNPKPNGTCTVSFDRESHEVTLTWSGLTIKRGYYWNIGGNELTIKKGSDNDNWYCSAITDTLYTVNGTSKKLTLAQIPADSTELINGINNGYAYQIGYFLLDNENNIIVDSGRYSFSKDNNVDFSLNTESYKSREMATMPYDGTPSYKYGDKTVPNEIKVAIQAFKVGNDGNGTAVELSSEEARELEKLISIQDQN